MPRTRKTPSDTADRTPIFVKFARTGGEVQELCLNGARTVGAVLEVAGQDLEDEDRVRVNGRLANEETAVGAGDVITV